MSTRVISINLKSYTSKKLINYLDTKSQQQHIILITALLSTRYATEKHLHTFRRRWQMILKCFVQ